MFRTNQKRELYEILGVSPTASKDEINSAYKKASLRAHPDKGGSEEDFKKINHAKSVLMDDDRRRMYDMTGDDSERPEQPPNVGVPINISKIFEQFVNVNMPRSKPQKADKAPPKIQKIKLSLSQFYHGHQMDIKFTRQKFCGDCNGSGYSIKIECNDCHGRGMIDTVMQMGPLTIHNTMPCHGCNGQGSKGTIKCSGCAGASKINDEKVLKVIVKPGTLNGETIVFPEACSDSHEYNKPGDVHIVLEEALDDDWIRNGTSLETNITLNLAEALIGTKVKLTEHPSGKSVLIHVKAGTQNGERLTFPDQGMPDKSGGHGPLYVNVQVQPKPGEREKLNLSVLAEMFGVQEDMVIEY